MLCHLMLAAGEVPHQSDRLGNYSSSQAEEIISTRCGCTEPPVDAFCPCRCCGRCLLHQSVLRASMASFGANIGCCVLILERPLMARRATWRPLAASMPGRALKPREQRTQRAVRSGSPPSRQHEPWTCSPVCRFLRRPQVDPQRRGPSRLHDENSHNKPCLLRMKPRWVGASSSPSCPLRGGALWLSRGGLLEGCFFFVNGSVYR
ncbi:hypothetical protein BS50DRAFT_70678 [Corynespora cassiicola Philippines]|uniref:Uncharacterized protein n=1 Tax=Corynespora cassiicola Philippines TaxID=1448308 RepID=A0A2T2NFX1_CORCC|nr:hypothetical protein BS50DRAFT_70678 [Corynespora cassiicola Philippines]